MKATGIAGLAMILAGCAVSAAEVAKREKSASQATASNLDAARDKVLRDNDITYDERASLPRATIDGGRAVTKTSGLALGAKEQIVELATPHNGRPFALVVERCDPCSCDDDTFYAIGTDRRGATVIIRLKAQTKVATVKQEGACEAARCGEEGEPGVAVYAMSAVPVRIYDATFTRHEIRAECDSYVPVP